VLGKMAPNRDRQIVIRYVRHRTEELALIAAWRTTVQLVS
jgi:hypothetical protein